jgi:repressor LexA
MAPKTPPGMTRKQVLHFVRKRLQQGMPPTVREVQDAFGFRSVQTAREHLETLVKEGKLVKEAGVARGYRLPREARAPLPVLVPLLGRVQAGEPTLAVEEVAGYLPVEERRDEDLFALRVQGDSMKGAGILAGDLVVVRRQPDADHGDIVVAIIDDEATVKRLWKKGDQVELRPENPRFAPIPLDAGDPVLIGRVIEVRRYLDSLKKM